MQSLHSRRGDTIKTILVSSYMMISQMLLHIFCNINWNLTITRWGSPYYDSHFTDKETEAQQGCLTSLGSKSRLVFKTRFQSGKCSGKIIMITRTKGRKKCEKWLIKGGGWIRWSWNASLRRWHMSPILDEEREPAKQRCGQSFPNSQNNESRRVIASALRWEDPIRRSVRLMSSGWGESWERSLER